MRRTSEFNVPVAGVVDALRGIGQGKGLLDRDSLTACASRL